jgi:cyclic-di-GMP-binding biofilm dispersal mediator protein
MELRLRRPLILETEKRHDNPISAGGCSEWTARVLAALDVAGHRVALDVRDPDASRAAVAPAVETNGGLDVLVNAVGVVAFGSVDDLSVDAMEELFLTTTFVPILLAKAALAAMTPGGVIVNISGEIAEQNMAVMAAFGASKAAVESFDQALIREARRKKTRVICDPIDGDLKDLRSSAFGSG